MPPTNRHAALAVAAIALAVPAAAAAAPAADRIAAVAGAPQPVAGTPFTDGTLILRSVNGVVALGGKGSVIGQVVGKARLLIEDTDPNDGVPVVTGADRAVRQGRFAVLYTGNDLRFRVLGGQFHLKVVAATVNLSFVGRGAATLTPAGTLDDGAYSLDGGDTYRPVMLAPTTVFVGGATSTTSPASTTPASIPDLIGGRA